jgi:cold shock CspA family protein
MEETEPEHDRDTGGEVEFYNSTRGYGFIESGEVADGE